MLLPDRLLILLLSHFAPRFSAVFSRYGQLALVCAGAGTLAGEFIGLALDSFLAGRIRNGAHTKAVQFYIKSTNSTWTVNSTRYSRGARWCDAARSHRLQLRGQYRRYGACRWRWQRRAVRERASVARTARRGGRGRVREKSAARCGRGRRGTKAIIREQVHIELGLMLVLLERSQREKVERQGGAMDGRASSQVSPP